MKIAVIDYGIGNLLSFKRAFQRIAIEASITSSSEDIKQADRIILPGVGHFAECMEKFEHSGLRQVIEEEVMGNGKPLLGICVGMQMLARHSEEGDVPGLGWIDAQVRRFPNDYEGQSLRVPHVGWNRLQTWDGPLFAGLEGEMRFYFTHSYYVETASSEDILADCLYGPRFAAVIGKGRIAGVQFHPEKSHGLGLKILQNFAEKI